MIGGFGIASSTLVQNDNAQPLTGLESKVLQIVKKNFDKFFSEETTEAHDRLLQEKLVQGMHLWNQYSKNCIPLKEVQEKSLSEFIQKYLSDSASNTNPFFRTLKPYSSRMSPFLISEKNNFTQLLDAQFEWVPVRRDEMLRLLIARKREKGSPINCLVIEIDELPQILSIVRQSPAPFRMQLLVRNEVHYTALDISWKPEQMECAVMDAYGEEKAHRIENAFLGCGCRVFTLGKNQHIQLDQRSCSLFSLSHVFASSKDPGFFETLRKNSVYSPDTGLHYVEWSDLPATMIKLSQNQSVIDLFKEKKVLEPHPQQYFSNHSPENTLKKWVRQVKDLIHLKGLNWSFAIAAKSPLSIGDYRDQNSDQNGEFS